MKIMIRYVYFKNNMNMNKFKPLIYLWNALRWIEIFVTFVHGNKGFSTIVFMHATKKEAQF